MCFKVTLCRISVWPTVFCVGDPWHFSAEPDLDPDPTSFLINFKDATKHMFVSNFFRITCQQAHHLQSKKFNFLPKFCVKILFCWHNFSPLNTSMRKGKEPDPDPWLWLMDPDPGAPKTCGSGSPNTGFSPSQTLPVLQAVWRRCTWTTSWWTSCRRRSHGTRCPRAAPCTRTSSRSRSTPAWATGNTQSTSLYCKYFTFHVLIS